MTDQLLFDARNLVRESIAESDPEKRAELFGDALFLMAERNRVVVEKGEGHDAVLIVRHSIESPQDKPSLPKPQLNLFEE